MLVSRRDIVPELRSSLGDGQEEGLNWFQSACRALRLGQNPYNRGMHKNPNEDLKYLISYMSLSEEDKAIEVAYNFGWVIVHKTNTIDDLLGDEDLSGSVRSELESFDPEKDEQLGELSDETIKAIASAMDVDKILDLVLEHFPDEYPLWAAAALRDTDIREGWLLYPARSKFDAEEIEVDGFECGIGLYGDKECPGYNFAYEAEHYRVRLRSEKEHLVLFRAPFVTIWNYLEGERGAAFWGTDAKDRYSVIAEHGFYTFMLEDKSEDEVEAEADSVDDMIRIINGKAWCPYGCE
jgi:hypothetical protein